MRMPMTRSTVFFEFREQMRERVVVHLLARFPAW